MRNITFETLPTAVTLLLDEVNEIKRLLLQKDSKQIEIDCWFNLSELCDYHPDKPKKATVYGWVNSRKIPSHKTNKKLRFLKSEIDLWLKEGKKKTFDEIYRQAEIDSRKKK